VTDDSKGTRRTRRRRGRPPRREEEDGVRRASPTLSRLLEQVNLLFVAHGDKNIVGLQRHSGNRDI
jgi:hypothetical protein